MNKITNQKMREKFKDGTFDQKIFVHWGIVNQSLNQLQNEANMKVFSKLFDSYQEASRLWDYFVIDCNRDIHKFLTYLTTQQRNELIINAYENKAYLYS